MKMKNIAEFVLDNAENKPEEVREILIKLHQKGETVDDLLEFIKALNLRKIKVETKNSEILKNKKIYDICGTGGSGKSRINLSTALAVKLAKNGFCIAKHGNKAASGRVGSFDLIQKLNLEISDTPAKTRENLENNNLAFVFAPAFHPALKPLAPIRKSIAHPTIFNYLGPLLNPIENIHAQMVGVGDIKMLSKLGGVAKKLKRNILFVHDAEFGLDDVSIGGKTVFVKVINGRDIEFGEIYPQDFSLQKAENFAKISGGNVENNQKIFEKMIQEKAPQEIQNFLEINYLVAKQFFEEV
jgi:anthranilate phosphoribosyltransferase